MTIPDDSPPPSAPHARARRPEPERTHPIRSATLGAEHRAANEGVGLQSPIAADDPVSEAVAHTVRMGYDVVAANIKSGRVAASRFRDGEYNIRDVPGDVGAMGRRLLSLAREVSATSFDVIEQLLAHPGVAGATARGAAVPPATTVRAPPFHPTPTWVAPTATARAAATPAAPETVSAVPITCDFHGSTRATVTSAMLSRPTRPTHPDQLATTPLAAKTSGVPAIQGVTFTADAASGGVIAHIAIPKDQPAGVYSAMIYAPSSDAPLGFLGVEIAE